MLINMWLSYTASRQPGLCTAAQVDATMLILPVLERKPDQKRAMHVAVLISKNNGCDSG